ncbi:AraC family transcriptional regulator [Wenyingzhuangia sp. 1_MG-2023]|nr:AraC family transcriptional regulator [Wenyingzhuangia sp. 1_MG-2023]
MKNIPNISFQSTENTKDFELLNLRSLFAKLPNIQDHNPTQPHRISFFSLLIVIKGTGYHQIDLKNYELKAGTVLKIAKGQVHAFQKNPTYEGYLIIFTEDFVIHYFSKSSINLISHLYNYHLTSPISNETDLNESFLNQLKKETTEESTITQKNIIASLINIYLLQLERQTKNKTLKNYNQRHFDIFIKFKNLVEKNYTNTRNVKDYAEMLLISRKLLNQIVKEFTLNTSKTFVDNYLVLEAKRRIITSNQNIKEISFEMGFIEVTNFTKFFKKKTGVSPKVFKTTQNQ